MTNFWTKVRKVGDDLLATGDYKSVANTLRETVELIRLHPTNEPQFEAALIEILDNPDRYSVLVVTYCMHELRFQSVLRHAEARLLRNSHRIDMHARQVLEACSPDWPVKSLFTMPPESGDVSK